MAIAFVANLGTAQKKVADTTLVYTLTAGQSVAVGHRIFIVSAQDWATGSTTATDSGGNTWVSANNQDAGLNIMTFIFSTLVTTALTTGSTITLTTVSNVTSKAMSIVVFSGMDPAANPDRYPVNASGTGTAPTVSSQSFTPAGERLYIVSSAKEAPTNTIGAVTNWTAIPPIATSGGGGTSNVQAAGAWRIGTTGGSAETYNPSHSSSAVWVFALWSIAVGAAAPLAPRPLVMGQAVNRASGF